MKGKRKHIYLDDFEHRLLVGCLMTARNEYISAHSTKEVINTHRGKGQTVSNN